MKIPFKNSFSFDFSFKGIVNELRKISEDHTRKIRRENKRAMNAVVTELLKDVKESTPVDTASLLKTWVKYYNVEKNGLSTYGSVYLNKDYKYKINVNKRGRKTSRKMKNNEPKLKTDKIKHPYEYGYIVERKQKFVERTFNKNKKKYADIYFKYLSELGR